MSRQPENLHSSANFTRVDLGAPAEWIGFTRNLGGVEFGKLFLQSVLGLTGMEVSVGVMPPGTSVPFLHAHKQNEELYLVISGDGEMQVDGEKFPLKPGTAVRVGTSGVRCLRAGSQSMSYIVVQAKSGSLEQANRADGIVPSDPVVW